jgi:hypothetical protein
MFNFTSQSLCWKSQLMDPCIEEHVIFFSHLLLRLSHRNLPTLNIAMLLACTLNVLSVATDS